jgi:ferredoxin
MLSLNDETCIECGICVDLLPQYFEVADGSVRVRRDAPDPVNPGDDAALKELARDCPSDSIRL